METSILIYVLMSVASALSVYKEDVLYMQRNDLKTIKMNDFFPSSILTMFYFSDPTMKDTEIDGIVTPPNGLKVYQSKYTYFDTSYIPERDGLEGSTSILKLIDQYYSFQTKDEFKVVSILSLETDTPSYAVNQRARESVSGFKTLFQEVFENNVIYFFRQIESPNKLIVRLYFLNSSNPKNLLEQQAEAQLENLKFDDYTIHEFVVNSGRMHFLGYRKNLDPKDLPLFECTFIFNERSEKIDGKCDMMENDFQGFDSNEVISISYRTETLIVVNMRNKVNRTMYYNMKCRSLATKKFKCDQAALIPVSLPTQLNHVPVDLGSGLLGFAFENFFMYSPDILSKKYLKIYLTIDKGVFENPPTSMISSSIKNKKYIVLGLSRSGSKKIYKYFVIEEEIHPPEVLESETDSDFFQVQDNIIYMSNKDKNIQAVSFRDAFVSINGTAAYNKTQGKPNGNATQEMKFQIISKVQNGITGRKDFKVVVVNEPMEAIDVKIPFDSIKVIRGGTIGISMKEDFISGNDLEVSISSGSIMKINLEGNTVYKVNSSTIGEKNLIVEKMILIWDNMLLISSKSTDMIYICDLVKVGGDSVQCKMKISFSSPAKTKVVNAQLLNFQALIVHYAYKEEIQDLGLHNNSLIIYNLSTTIETGYRNISTELIFVPEKGERQVFIYAYQGSAVCYFNSRFPPEEKKNYHASMYMIQAKSNKVDLDSYYFEKSRILIDAGRIKTIVNVVPDLSTKFYFYLTVIDPNNIREKLYANIELTRNPQIVKLNLPRKLSNRRVSSGENHYCGMLSEFLVYEARNSERNFDSFYVVPFFVNDPIYEKMIRNLPLNHLGYDKVLAFECMAERNSMLAVVIGTDSNKPETYQKPVLINYNLDHVHDPRKRLETIVPIPDLTENGLILSANSAMYKYKDFAILSYIPKDSTERKIIYIEQLIKIQKFEIFCPMFAPPEFDLNLIFRVASSKKNVLLERKIKVEVRPLEYQTKITINNMSKLPKKVSEFDLEKTVLNITGHYFTSRLVDSKTKIPVGESSMVQLKERKKETEKILTGGLLSANAVWEHTFILTSAGNVELYTGSKFVGIIAHFANYMKAGEIPSSIAKGQMYLVTGEDIMNGIVITYYQISRMQDSPVSKMIEKIFNQTLSGSFSRFQEEFCGQNLYMLLFENSGQKILLVKFAPSSMKIEAVKNLTLEHSAANLDLVCLEDSLTQDQSVALIILYDNQQQMAYKFNKENGTEHIMNLEFTFLKEKKYHVSDFECEVIPGNNLSLTSKTFLTKFKCFYSTRWADDYVVEYAIESGPDVFRIASAQKTLVVPEVNHFNPLKTIADNNTVLVFGENLLEPKDNRSIYVLVYEFHLNNTQIKSYLKISKSLDMDPHWFSNLASISNEGKIVHLSKSNELDNNYDSLQVLEIVNLSMKVSSESFDPMSLTMEMISITGDFLERVNLGGIFDMEMDAKRLFKNQLARVMIFCAVLVLFIFILSFAFSKYTQSHYGKIRKEFINGASQNHTEEQRMEIEKSIELFLEKPGKQYYEEALDKLGGEYEEEEDIIDELNN